MKSETFRKQALSLIIFFVAVAAVFFVASRLRGDPAEKQAQTILTQLLSSSDAVNRRRTIPTPPASRALCRWMTAALRLSIRHSSGTA